MKSINYIPCTTPHSTIRSLLGVFFLLLFTCVNIYAQPNTSTKYEVGWEPGGNTGNKKNKVWKIALVDAAKNPIFPWGTYDHIGPYSGNVFIVGKGKGQYEGSYKYYGLYDADLRKEIQPCTAKRIVAPDSCTGYIQDKNWLSGYLDLKGNDVASQRYMLGRGAKTYSQVYNVVSTVLVHGLIDKCGKELTPLHYTNMSFEKEGYITVERGGKFTFIDIQGKEQIPPTYMFLSDFSNGLAAFSETGSFVNGIYQGTSWGFINTKGNILSNDRFDDVANANKFLIVDGSVNVKKGNEWISYAPNLSIASKPKVVPFRDEKKELWGYRVDGGGEVVIKPQYENAWPFENGRAFVERRQYFSKHSEFYLRGVIDEKGSVIIALDYAEISQFAKNYYKVGQKSKEMEYGLLDSTGRIVIPADFVFMGELKEGMIALRKYDGNAGYMNIKGEYVIQPVFKGARDFSEGLAPVTKDEKTWYWIDYSGKPFMDAAGFLAVTGFKNGIAEVWTAKDQWGRYDGKMTIDSDGKTLQKYAMNAPPTTIEYEVECYNCRGSGASYMPVTKTTTTTDVDNYNVFAPGGKVITTTTRKKTEYVRTGNCMYCNGKGRVKTTRLKFY